MRMVSWGAREVALADATSDEERPRRPPQCARCLRGIPDASPASSSLDHAGVGPLATAQGWKLSAFNSTSAASSTPEPQSGRFPSDVSSSASMEVAP